MKYYILFIVSSFIGWVYEVIATYLLYDGYYDRGILHLPMCPIYGVGMLLLYMCLRKVQNVFWLFVCSGLITTALELSASYVIEYGFHYSLWSYEGWPLNFQNRVSLISSMIFGVMAVLVFKLIKPGLDKEFDEHAKRMNIIAIVGTIILIAVQIMGMRGMLNIF